jgi:23S rRNA pseudouridine2605 synthase
MAEGVELEDGMTAPAVVNLIKSGEVNDWISVTIHEGRNRQVRRMCEAVSLSVVRLKRIRYGSLMLGTLRAGQFRYLTDAEVRQLAEVPADAVPAGRPQQGRPQREVHRKSPHSVRSGGKGSGRRQQ